MSEPTPPGASAVNGRLWGARARDWAEVQEGQCRPAFEAVFDRVGLGAGARCCDVGCGAGLAALLASQRGARVCGVDAAEGLLDLARSRLPAGDFRLGDLQALPFADGSFDLVTGFNAFQFAADPVAALTEARRVLRPGGRVVVLAWGDPQGMDAATLLLALKPLLPPPPPGAPGPFALSDRRVLTALVERAGLSVQAVSDLACDWTYPDLHTALRGLGASGGAARATEQVGAQAVDRAHEQALAPFRQDDGSYRLGASFHWVLATNAADAAAAAGASSV